MRAGAARNVITIQRLIQMGVTEHNAPSMVWADWRAGLFAELEVIRGKEQFNQLTLQRFSQEIYKFTLRYDFVIGVDTSMQIIDQDGLKFDIKAVLPDKRTRVDCVIEAVLQDGVLGSASLMAFLYLLPPAGVHGQSYSGFQIAAKGGTGPYTFALTTGTLPAGLALNGATGSVTGTPTAPGTTDGLIFTVTDAVGATADLPPVSITIS